jgi:hypothetical protein
MSLEKPTRGRPFKEILLLSSRKYFRVYTNININIKYTKPISLSLHNILLENRAKIYLEKHAFVVRSVRPSTINTNSKFASKIVPENYCTIQSSNVRISHNKVSRKSCQTTLEWLPRFMFLPLIVRPTLNVVCPSQICTIRIGINVEIYLGMCVYPSGCCLFPLSSISLGMCYSSPSRSHSP